MHDHKTGKTTRLVLKDIQKTVEEVSEDLFRNVQEEKVLRKKILGNTLSQIQHIQDNKQAIEMHIESFQEKRSSDVKESVEDLERALLSGNLKNIENILKNTLI